MSDVSAAGARVRPVCAISGRVRPRKDLVALETLRPTLADRIRQDHPDLPAEALISRKELARYRQTYIEEALQEEHGAVSELERRVAESIAQHDTLAENVEEEFEEQRTTGEVLSDHLASFGGSWAFIIFFGAVLVVWMAINVAIGEKDAFDPYPFILLNLVLSCLAAIQAPIIMMSQKRQEAKDRLRSLNDYRVNLKAELEIRHLHEKLDYLLTRQWQRMAEIQQLQVEMMAEKHSKVKKKKYKAAAAAAAGALAATGDADPSLAEFAEEGEGEAGEGEAAEGEAELAEAGPAPEEERSAVAERG